MPPGPLQRVFSLLIHASPYAIEVHYLREANDYMQQVHSVHGAVISAGAR